MPNIDCSICVVSKRPIPLVLSSGLPAYGLQEAILSIQVDERADGVVGELFAKPDKLPCNGLLFFDDIASMAVTAGLIHPDAHGGRQSHR